MKNRTISGMKYVPTILNAPLAIQTILQVQKANAVPENKLAILFFVRQKIKKYIEIAENIKLSKTTALYAKIGLFVIIVNGTLKRP